MKWGIALISAVLAATSLARDVSDCSCGFVDEKHDQIWTDALIVYFNETNQIPDEFDVLDFHHNKEYGYNSLYRQGASPANAQIGDFDDTNINATDGLQLWIDPGTGQHYVQGSGIEAKRQDIHFGTFRAAMRGAPKNTGGSAMSMRLYYNRTSFIELDMCNMQRPSDAKFLYLKDGEFPDPEYQLNYTIFANNTNATVGGDPWQFVESKIDWTRKYVNWTTGGNLTRSEKRSRIDLSEPLPLQFKHWSIGDKYWMAGPPTERNQADVAYVRAFFNSSLTTKAEQKDFDSRCQAADFCSVDDLTLRGSTPYQEEALIPYKEPPASESWRIAAGIVSGSFFAFGCLTLINVLFRRAPWKLLLKRNRGKNVHVEPELSSPSPFVASLLGISDAKPAPIPQPPEKRASKGDISVHSVPVGEADGNPFSADNMRRRSVKWFNPFDSNAKESVERHDHAYTTGTSEVPRTYSTVQPTDWRRKSLAYHGALPDVVPANSYAGRKASVAFADDTFRPRQASIFQSIRSRTGSTMQAIGEVIQHGVVGSNENKHRIEPIELQEGLLPETEKPVRGSVTRGSVARRESQAWQEVDLSHQTEANRRHTLTRGRQPSVLERYRENHFASIASGPRASRTSISVKDWNTQRMSEVDTVDPPHESQIRPDRRITLAEAVPVAAVDMPLPKAKQHEARINYLAGLVAFSSIGVTLIHFFLTFSPYSGGLNYGQHYRSEYWARWTVTPAILNPIWLGPFFVTSCRFLSARYFREGDLANVAEKMLLRAPRLVIPCVIVAALEYFFFEMEFMQWLQWLPSITWSEWAFISNYNNFGNFLNDMLELFYLIPNAAPQVVSHYCVGVLWSIPVQLQYSFVTLLAVVMVRDIKTGWKRFCFYAWCIVVNWYALSWGSCFWAGLMLADLQVTYHFSAGIQARPVFRWVFCIAMWIIAFASAAMTLLEDRLSIPTMTAERNIHPDMYTGERLGKTIRGGYPLYFEPRLNTLTFSIAMQLLVETSTWFQAFLSMRLWQPIFPHAFTIYLIHGFIWWTLGSYMAVQIGSKDVPYWAVLLSIAVVCYFTLALTVIALSFLTETVTSAACRNIARWAMEPAVPKQPTLEPFPRGLFLDRNSDNALKDEETGPRPGVIVNDAEKEQMAMNDRRHTVGDYVIEEEEEEDDEDLDPMDPKSSVGTSSLRTSTAGESSSASGSSTRNPSA